MNFTEYADHDALGLAELVAKKQVSATELVEEAIARIEKHNPKLNAVIFKTYDRARSAARLPLQVGPFAGVPFLLKDILGAQKGVPTRQGSDFIPPAPAPHDATVVRRFTGSGLISLGKTNVPEFGKAMNFEPMAQQIKLGSIVAYSCDDVRPDHHLEAAGRCAPKYTTACVVKGKEVFFNDARSVIPCWLR